MCKMTMTLLINWMYHAGLDSGAVGASTTLFDLTDLELKTYLGSSHPEILNFRIRK